ncbi:MAG: hypothetical protein ACE141_09805 [Bryobacteraceae bacterium]
MTGRAVDWFLQSGIQESSGGVERYYRSDTRQPKPISTEITGYAISFLVYMHRSTGSAACLEAARRAGRYLTRVAWNPTLRTMPFECRGQGELAYFFDLGIIVRALLSLWHATGDLEFKQVAIGCALSMDNDFRGASGHYPVLALPEKRPLDGDGGWSRHPGCYQAKAAMAWLEAADAGAGDSFRRLYDEAIGRHLTAHASLVDSESDVERRMDRLHAYCYFLEALLPRAASPACAQALSEGIARVGRLLREIRPVFERADVYAQLLRLRIYADAAGVVPADPEEAGAEAAALRDFQLEDSDRRVDGGFCFGRKAGVFLPFINPVSTIFAVQALRMWAEYNGGRPHLRVQDLI